MLHFANTADKRSWTKDPFLWWFLFNLEYVRKTVLKFESFIIFSAIRCVIGSSKFPADLAALCPIVRYRQRAPRRPKKTRERRSNTAVTNCGRYRNLCFLPLRHKRRHLIRKLWIWICYNKHQDWLYLPVKWLVCQHGMVEIFHRQNGP